MLRKFQKTGGVYLGFLTLREKKFPWELFFVRVLRREALSEHILSAKPWFRDRLVEVVAYRALVVLLDDADDNGAVLLRGFAVILDVLS